MPSCKNINELSERLKKQGIIETQIHTQSAGKAHEGVSFSKGLEKFKGSQIDKHMSLNYLTKAIERNIEKTLEHTIAKLVPGVQAIKIVKNLSKRT